MSRRGLALVCVVAAALALGGCGQGGDGQRLSIATGGSGGVYFVYGGGIAEQIGEHLDGYQATAEVTSASVDNMYLIADGKSDLAFALADTAADAVNGTDTFDGERVPAQALARLYNNLTQVATVKGKGIESVEDLRGKRVSVARRGRAPRSSPCGSWRRPASTPTATSAASSSGWARACRRSRTAPWTPSSGRAASPPAP
jgi:TRAP transporter TAXI family solute receptor